MSCCFYFTCIWETHIQKHLSLPMDMNNGVTQALLEVCTEKQDHPGRISSHLLFLLFHINREAESFETPYENRKVNAWIPCSSPAGYMMLQGGAS